jgi:hypothetical protein
MIIIERNLSTIKFEISDSNSGTVRLNNQLYTGSDLKYKVLNVSGNVIKKYEVANLKFSIMNNKVFGKSIYNHVFKGAIGETLKYSIPEINNDFLNGMINICGHEH